MRLSVDVCGVDVVVYGRDTLTEGNQEQVYPYYYLRYCGVSGHAVVRNIIS